MNNSSFDNQIEVIEPPSNNNYELSKDSAVPEQLPQNIHKNGELSLSIAESALNEDQIIGERQRHVLREELKCSICFDLFRQPVSLSACGHTFCRVCIEAYLQHLSTGADQMAAVFVHCPLCRRQSCITRAGSYWHLVENLSAANMVAKVIGIFYK